MFTTSAGAGSTGGSINLNDIKRARRRQVMPKSSHSQFWTSMVPSCALCQDRVSWAIRASVLSLGESDVSRSSLLQYFRPWMSNRPKGSFAAGTYRNMTAAFSLVRPYNLESPHSATPGHPNSTGYCNDVVSGCHESSTVAEMDCPLPSKRRKIFESHLAAVQGQS